MTNPVQATFDAIRAQIEAGEDFHVAVIAKEDGDVIVRWGVDDLPRLELTAENAVQFADALEAANWLPELVPMIREASAACFAERRRRAQ